MRKWLNIGSNQSDYSVDPEDEDDADYEEDDPDNDLQNEVWGRQSQFMDGTGVDAPSESKDFVPKLRKHKSSTYISQYINSKELRVCAATWNVGGRLPSDDLDIDDLDIIERAYNIFFNFPGINICQHVHISACPYIRHFSGENEGDELKRNYDVHEILRRTHFHPPSIVGLPKGILDHERIIWLGDLNYRLNLSDAETKALIKKKQWSKLAEKDQLMREIKNGAFGGWSEGALNFPPTYKYEVNSDKYYGGDPKAPKRTPAWCDRVLSYGKGMKLLNYRRTELKLSDHRPVTATYIVEVESFSPRKLQRALTFTNAEIENEEAIKHLVSWK